MESTVQSKEIDNNQREGSKKLLPSDYYMEGEKHTRGSISLRKN